MDKTEILKEKLADAEVVLIGIGEEFNEKFDRIAEHEQLVKGLELVDAKEELAWMVPYFEKIYLLKIRNHPGKLFLCINKLQSFHQLFMFCYSVKLLVKFFTNTN